MIFKRSKLRSKKSVLFVVTSLAFLAACGNNKPFDSVVWLKADTRERGRMSDDLIKSRVLVGQTADKALLILGQPDTTYATALIYRIDMGIPLKDDPKHTALQAHLDGDRIIREVKIVD